MSRPETFPLVLAFHPASRGVGWVLLQGPSAPVDWGITFLRSDSHRGVRRSVETLVERYRPEVLVVERYHPAVRSVLGPAAQIGVTCHDSRHLAMEAGEAGADYVAFGAFYQTTTKPTTHRPDPAILSWWTTVFEPPCVAIGGITPDNARVLVEAGADFLAVSSAVWNDPQGPAAAVARFKPLLANRNG